MFLSILNEKKLFFIFFTQCRSKKKKHKHEKSDSKSYSESDTDTSSSACDYDDHSSKKLKREKVHTKTN